MRKANCWGGTLPPTHPPPSDRSQLRQLRSRDRSPFRCLCWCRLCSSRSRLYSCPAWRPVRAFAVREMNVTIQNGTLEFKARIWYPVASGAEGSHAAILSIDTSRACMRDRWSRITPGVFLLGNRFHTFPNPENATMIQRGIGELNFWDS